MRCATCGTKLVTKLRWKPGPTWFHAKGVDLPDLHAPEPKWTNVAEEPTDRKAPEGWEIEEFIEAAYGLYLRPDLED